MSHIILEDIGGVFLFIMWQLNQSSHRTTTTHTGVKVEKKQSSFFLLKYKSSLTGGSVSPQGGENSPSENNGGRQRRFLC